MPHLYLFAKITPKAEHLDDARTAIQGIIAQTVAEEGCIQFHLHDGLDDGCLYLYEEWVNEDALAHHYDQPYTKAVFESYKEWLAAPVEGHKMRLAS
ncbi:MAG: antibiotic biosynthesis monooxygenase [Alphaproteobacteria bacterium]|nr:antibiotic biosynthesis monooxygenase [Alphaproteobacteria bacterium]